MSHPTKPRALLKNKKKKVAAPPNEEEKRRKGYAADASRDEKIQRAAIQLAELGASRVLIRGSELIYKRWNYDRTMVAEIHYTLPNGSDESSLSFDAEEDTVDFDHRQEEERALFEQGLDEKRDAWKEHRARKKGLSSEEEESESEE